MKNLISSILLLISITSAYSQGKAEAILAAAQFGVEVSEKAIDAIWSATGMNDKPYVHAFIVDVNAASSSTGHIYNGPDGDRIVIKRRRKQQTTRKNLYRFTLTQPHGNWWKAITTHRKPNTFDHEIVSVEGSSSNNKVLVNYEDMLKYHIVLSKAKAFGAHTNMYWIKNSYDLTPDYDWTFEWQKD